MRCTSLQAGWPVACLWVATFVSSTLLGAEWRQFRGDGGLGRAAETEVPVTWSSTQNLRWRTALPGPGSSSPVVTGDRIFVTSYSGYGVDRNDPGELEDLTRHLVCVDRHSGSILWARPVAARQPEDPYRGFISEHGYASNSPVVTDSRVFVFFGKTGVLAFDHEGNEKWRADVGQESSNRRWGSAASLVTYGNSVIVNASDESQSVRAFDQETGSELWKAEAASLELAYGTPVLAKTKSGETNLVLSVPNEVWGLNPDDGKLRWFAETGLPGNICPTLVCVDGIAYGFGGYPRQGSFALQMGGNGELPASSMLWESRVSSYVASPVYHAGYLYWITDRGDAVCVRASDGEEQYQERLPGLTGSSRQRAAYASMIFVGGKLYAVSRYSGTYVLAAEPQFKVLAQNRFSDDESQFNGTPAVTGNRLILRSDQYLYAVGAE